MGRTERRRTRPSPHGILRIIHGHWAAAALATADSYAIFNLIGPGTRSCGHIARTAGLSRHGAQALLDALAALRLVEVRKGRYRNSLAANRYLLKGTSEYLGDLSRALFLSGGVGRLWPALPGVVRDGTALAQWRNLLPLFRTAEYALDLVEAIRPLTLCAARVAAARLRFAERGAVSILDVGGGSGAFCEVLLTQNARATATQVDRRAMNQLAWRHMKEANLEDRFHAVDGEFERVDLPNGFDVAVVSFFAHLLSDEENQSILKRISSLLSPDGIVIVNDYIVGEDRRGDPIALLSGLNWLYFSKHGQVWRRSDVRRWFRGAGFGEARFETTPLAATLAYGRKCLAPARRQ